VAIHHDKMAYGKLAPTSENLTENKVFSMLEELNNPQPLGEIVDLHIHTKFSQDSKEELENYIVQAIKYGHKFLGFSDHYDYDYILDNLPITLPDLREYENKISSLKEKFSDKIIILKGIEFGYCKQAEAYYTDLINNNNFDYVISSLHTLKGRGDCYFANFFNNKSKKEAFDDYLDGVLQSVNANFNYQIIGHIGYVARNAPFEDKKLYYSEFADKIDAILKAIINRGVALEINSSVGKSGATFTPDCDIISRYVELGGKNITFGSDAHKLERYFYNADKVKGFLRSLGINQVCYFLQQKINYIKF